MKLRPLHDRVIVKRIESEPKPLPASSSPITPQKSLTKVKCWRLAPARKTTKATSAR